jgi:pyrroloquinoline quinone biosynthesis protein E
MIAGDAAMADPVCHLSPHRGRVDEAISEAARTVPAEHPLVFRDPANSKRLTADASEGVWPPA